MISSQDVKTRVIKSFFSLSVQTQLHLMLQIHSKVFNLEKHTPSNELSTDHWLRVIALNVFGFLMY